MKRLLVVASLLVNALCCAEDTGMQVYVRNISNQDVVVVPEEKGAKTCGGQSIKNGERYTIKSGDSRVFWAGRSHTAEGEKDCQFLKFQIIEPISTTFKLDRDWAGRFNGNGHYIEIVNKTPEEMAAERDRLPDMLKIFPVPAIKAVHRPWFVVSSVGQHSQSGDVFRKEPLQLDPHSYIMTPFNNPQADKWKAREIIKADANTTGMEIRFANLSGENLKVVPDDTTASCSGQNFTSGSMVDVPAYTERHFRSGGTKGDKVCELKNFKIYDRDGFITTLRFTRVRRTGAGGGIEVGELGIGKDTTATDHRVEITGSRVNGYAILVVEEGLTDRR